MKSVSSFQFPVSSCEPRVGFNSRPGTRNSKLAAAIALAMFCAGAPAQTVSDPTRPPAGFDSGVADAAADAGGGVILQSVLISPTQKAAIIGGVMVKLGEKYGDAVLVKVAENEVVLKSGGGLQVLKLHPGVEKREIAPAAGKSAPRRTKTATGAAPAR